MSSSLKRTTASASSSPCPSILSSSSHENSFHGRYVVTIGCAVVWPVVAPTLLVTCYLFCSVALSAVWLPIVVVVALGQARGGVIVRSLDGEDARPVPSISYGRGVFAPSVLTSLMFLCGVLCRDVSVVTHTSSPGSSDARVRPLCWRCLQSPSRWRCARLRGGGGRWASCYRG